MESLPLGECRILDAGSGMSNRLLDWYRPQVKHAYLLDFLLDSRVEGNTSVVRADLEQGIPMPDGSVDVVTSVSSIEHLSAAGQVLFLSEAQRVLRPGGIVAMTVSYLIGLDARMLAVLSSNPLLRKEGFSINAQLDLRKMLEAAPALRAPEEPLNRFPGFDGFSRPKSFRYGHLLDTVYLDNSNHPPPKSACWARAGRNRNLPSPDPPLIQGSFRKLHRTPANPSARRPANAPPAAGRYPQLHACSGPAKGEPNLVVQAAS
jgi:SAM-dependent methyltransferase